MEKEVGEREIKMEQVRERRLGEEEERRSF